MRDDLGCTLEVIERPTGARDFKVQHLRWIVEQSIARRGGIAGRQGTTRT